MDNKALKRNGPWNLQFGYWMEKKHSLMGTFPAIKKSNWKTVKGKVVICWDREDLKKIWENLPKSECRVHKYLFAISTKTKEILSLEKDYKKQFLDSGILFFVGEVKQLLEKKGFFEWAPGLLSFQDEKNAVFPEKDE